MAHRKSLRYKESTAKEPCNRKNLARRVQVPTYQILKPQSPHIENTSRPKIIGIFKKIRGTKHEPQNKWDPENKEPKQHPQFIGTRSTWTLSQTESKVPMTVGYLGIVDMVFGRFLIVGYLDPEGSPFGSCVCLDAGKVD